MVLITSSGLTIDLHYCGGKLKSFSVFGKARTCTEMNGCWSSLRPNFPSQKGRNCLEKSGCCSNRMVYFKSDLHKKNDQIEDISEKEANNDFSSCSFSSEPAILLKTYDVLSLFGDPFLHSEEDLHVLYQSFLL